jgi:Pectate lyase superfamily protein
MLAVVALSFPSEMASAQVATHAVTSTSVTSAAGSPAWKSTQIKGGKVRLTGARKGAVVKLQFRTKAGWRNWKSVTTKTTNQKVKVPKRLRKSSWRHLVVASPAESVGKVSRVRTGGKVHRPAKPSSGRPSTAPAPQDSAVSAPSAPAEVPLVMPAGAIDVTTRGIVGDGVTDNGAAIQDLIDSLPANSTVWFPAGQTFAHSTVLRVLKPGTRLTGGGTLLATKEETSSVWLEANNVNIDHLTLRMGRTSKRWETHRQMKLRLVGGYSNIRVSNTTIDGSAAAGIYIGQVTGYVLTDVTVKNTRADGIHQTYGANNGQLIRPTIINPGDDGIAVVTTANDPIAHDITVTGARILGQTWGRGLTVVGGDRITYTDFTIDSSAGAAIYVAAETEWNTKPSTNVLYDRGTITNANANTTIDHGAIVLYNSQPGTTNSDITLRNITISDTRSTASREISIINNGGTQQRLTLDNLTLWRGPKTLLYTSSSVPTSAYNLTNTTDDGNPITNRIGW